MHGEAEFDSRSQLKQALLSPPHIVDNKSVSIYHDLLSFIYGLSQGSYKLELKSEVWAY